MKYYIKRVHRVEIIVATDKPCTAKSVKKLLRGLIVGVKQIVSDRLCDPTELTIRHIRR